MGEIVQQFLAMVEKIKKLKPRYKETGDGSGGICDCIGLIIGAIRRMGLEWKGIHGSNWAARKELVELKKISAVKDLSVGDVVLKAFAKGKKGWDLPTRYREKGKYYNGDLNDYYHIGVVSSVSPLRITHMTTPTVRVDYTLGKWAYYGTLRILVDAAGCVIPTPPEPDAPAAGKTAIVTAATGRYVKMRREPSRSCRLWEEIPIGARVTLEAPGEEWAKVTYGRRKNWYMMAKYLNVEEG